VQENGWAMRLLTWNIDLNIKIDNVGVCDIVMKNSRVGCDKVTVIFISRTMRLLIFRIGAAGGGKQ